MLKIVEIVGNEKNSALIQCAGEMAFTGKNDIKRAGRVDWYHDGYNFEIKNGCSTITEIIKSRSSKIKVLFIPVPKVTEYKGKSYYDPYEQDGYILSKDAFLYILETCKLIREEKKTTAYYKAGRPITYEDPKKDSHYKLRYSMQTYWNRKQNKPNGTKYYVMMELLKELCEETLQEHIDRLGL